MRLKLRFLQAATALLYMGPLMAGLSGFDWWMVPPFVSIFVLWLALLRPHQWPRTNAEWLTRTALLSVAGQVLSQVVLVAACFGVGRGIGGVLGYLPMVHPILPVALSFAAIPMMRLFWDSERALAEGLVIDELLYPHPDRPANRPTAPAALTAETLASLLAIADDAPAAQTAAALEEALEGPDSWAQLSALTDALAGAPAQQHLALRRALIDMATEPESFVTGAAPGALRAAFAAAGTDEDLLRDLLPRALMLLHAAPGRADQFPDPAVVEDIGRRTASAEVAGLLERLAGAQRGPSLPEAKTGSARRSRRAMGGLALPQACRRPPHGRCKPFAGRARPR